MQYAIKTLRDSAVRVRYWTEMIAPFELLAIAICQRLEDKDPNSHIG